MPATTVSTVNKFILFLQSPHQVDINFISQMRKLRCIKIKPRVTQLVSDS